MAVGYSICGASAIGAVGEARRSEESDRAASIALVTLCGTLAIVVLPLLQHPLGLDDADFGRWVGASVHDVGQVVATAQGAGAEALREAVVVKLMRMLLLAPLVAVVAARRGRQGREAGTTQRRPPLVPLFVAGFLGTMALRASGVLPAHLLTPVGEIREIVMAVALVGLGSSVHLRSLTKSGARLALLGLFAWAVIAGASFVGIKLTA
ncbi:putative sulfate exporter family transporter [Streptomyces sp. ADI93-02]|uniref:YeiH family protein n=1 Tax=Streptomyces sp. ADI93-02 TaxID=1522757 RepID=UPI00321635B9